MQHQSITYSVKHFNRQFHRVLIKKHILISLLFGIPHGRSRWTWASAQTLKERRRKRNNNELNRVWTIIICAVLNEATSINNNSQTLLLRFKNNIRSVYTLAIAIDEVRDHLSVIIDWSSIGRCQSMLINSN